MKTKLLSENDLQIAAALLKAEQLVAFPTETVYGLGGRLFSEKAIQSIFRAKGRPSDNPLIAHMASPQNWEQLAERVPKTYHLLAEAFFPGPLTLIVAKKPRVPKSATGGLETVAIRCPDHDLARKLIKLVGEPLVAPSANLSGRPSSTTAQHVLADFEGKIPAVLDGGPCEHGLESTVIDLVSFEQPTLLRPGALKKEAIEEVLGHSIALYTKGPNSSPGMKYRHYAPSIPVYVFSDAGQFQSYLSKGRKTFSIDREELDGKTLYASLRFAEQNGYDDIAIESHKCSDPALLNRLEKIHASHYPE